MAQCQWVLPQYAGAATQQGAESQRGRVHRRAAAPLHSSFQGQAVFLCLLRNPTAAQHTNVDTIHPDLSRAAGQLHLRRHRRRQAHGELVDGGSQCGFHRHGGSDHRGHPGQDQRLASGDRPGAYFGYRAGIHAEHAVESGPQHNTALSDRAFGLSDQTDAGVARYLEPAEQRFHQRHGILSQQSVRFRRSQWH